MAGMSLGRRHFQPGRDRSAEQIGVCLRRADVT